MVIDTDACIACSSCAMACKIENNLPEQNWWNRILTVGGDNQGTPSGTYPDLAMSTITLACQHCENPACTRVCPVGATFKREEDGVVIQDYAKCIGCRMCIAACPYTGVRSFNWEEPHYTVPFAGDADIPAHQKHTVEKCNFCAHRLARGESPACIEVCPARARFFGDLEDPESEPSKLIVKRKHMQLLPEQGTRPSVYYLV
jgi:molybdopterin-containing oxidoreductase family iron-sulfur binding subunit